MKILMKLNNNIYVHVLFQFNYSLWTKINEEQDGGVKKNMNLFLSKRKYFDYKNVRAKKTI